MTDFDFDCAQKKRIARGAFNRKGTTNRKGCRLPHENLTKKELEKLNGEVYSISMVRPMPWDYFKTLPDTLQEEYLNTQVRRFGIGLANISTDMFGLSSSALHKHVVKHGLNVIAPPATKIPKAARESWERWLASGNNDAPKTETTQTPAEKYRAETQITHCEEPAKKENVKPFRAHDYPTRERGLELDEALKEAGLERSNLTEDKPKKTYPTNKLDITLTGTPVEILATLMSMFPTILDGDRRYRFRVSADTFTLTDVPGRSAL